MGKYMCHNSIGPINMWQPDLAKNYTSNTSVSLNCHISVSLTEGLLLLM